MAYAHDIAEQTARIHVEDGDSFFSIGRPIQSVGKDHYVARTVTGFGAQQQSITCTVYGGMVPDVVRELYVLNTPMIEMDDAAIVAFQRDDSTTWDVAVYRAFEDLTWARWVASRTDDAVLNLVTGRWV